MTLEELKRDISIHINDYIDINGDMDSTIEMIIESMEMYYYKKLIDTKEK
tara:strand:+ start:901 stop:1050 length:150 start_codon:yes stop_codon:yes gene_type:complete